MSASIPKITLNDGVSIPSLGFGTYKLIGEKGSQAIQSAIDSGYRLIVTAYNYENEGTVGEAVHKSSIPRNNLFIASKLPGRYHDYKKAIYIVQESLYRARLDYYDMYLITLAKPKTGDVRRGMASAY